MTDRMTQIGALVGSRICHDLISPIGAIGNGVELLQMSGLPDSPELELVMQSIAAANGRIRLYRVAFGAGAPGQTIARAEIRSILKDLEGTRGVSIDWAPAGDLPRDTARLIFLLLLCCESVLPFGGAVDVDGGDGPVTLQVEARRLRDRPDLWDFARPDADGTPPASEVHFLLAGAAAAEIGREIKVTGGDGQLTVTA